MKHISDELPRLLTGDATHDVVMEAAEHLRSCPDCQQELVSSVVAHASLTSAHRFAPEVVAPIRATSLSQSFAPQSFPSQSSEAPSALPPVTRIHGFAEDGSDDDETRPDIVEDDTDSPTDALPDMRTMFDQVRAEAARSQTAPRSHGGRRGLLAVAAAAVVLAGGGTAIGFAVDGGGSGGHTFALTRFEFGNATGQGTIKGDTVTLDAASLPKLPASQRYEVWLTNSERTTMYSIGFLGDGSKATFTVKHDELEHYSDVEVSKQGRANAYSGKSVLRGSYT